MNIKEINYKYIVIMKKSTFFNIVKFLVLIGSGALVLGQGLKYYILHTALLRHLLLKHVFSNNNITHYLKLLMLVIISVVGYMQSFNYLVYESGIHMIIKETMSTFPVA